MAQDDLNFPPGYVSPAYLVNQDLSNMMAQRKAEARQAMLDDLTRQLDTARIATELQNAQSLSEQRKQRADEYNSTWLKNIGGQYPIGANLDPATSAAIRAHQGGPLISPATNLPAGDQGPTKGETWMGTGPEQAQQRSFNSIDDLMREDSQFQDPKIQAIMKLMRASGASPADIRSGMTDITREMMAQPKNGVHRVEYGPDGKILSEKDYPAGTSFGNVPRPPQGPAPQFFTWKDATTGEDRAGWFAPGAKLPDEVTGLRHGNQPVPRAGANASSGGVFNPVAERQFNTIRAKTLSPNATPADRKQLADATRQALFGLVEQTGTMDATVKNFFNTIFADPQTLSLPIDQIFQHYGLTGDDKDLQTIRLGLSYIKQQGF